ncbi:PilZ domain protein [Stieleria neptunia]|uniref:PilZ domain protein n=1 Tax=Stieleria neptunia TaxID=2527979 RepID=A0A518HVC0_9BACT|nr:PilZ domain-containing protein [Stieleria neptunia]QDV44757.1 PilZ domain protein [Stieleria neptunia]
MPTVASPRTNLPGASGADTPALRTPEHPTHTIPVGPTVDDDRYEPRFQVIGGQDVRDIQCRLLVHAPLGGDDQIPCQIVDLNSSGCAIRYRHDRPLFKSTTLEIHNLAGHETLQMLARVCWSRQSGLDQYASGLYFRRSLPDDFISAGIRAGQLSRRAARRESVDVGVTIRQYQPQNRGAGRIVSTSRSGLQIIGPNELVIGTRVMLQLDDGNAVVGTTVWTSLRGSQYASGVAFTHAGTGRQFHNAVLQLS